MSTALLRDLCKHEVCSAASEIGLMGPSRDLMVWDGRTSRLDWIRPSGRTSA